MDNLPVIVIRFALYADLMVLAGITAFPLYALSRSERASGILPLKGTSISLAAVGLALSGLGLLALVAAMAGSSVWDVDPQVLREIVGESAIGTAWIIRMAALAVAVVAAMTVNRSQMSQFTLLTSTSVALGTLVWTGHAGATEGWVGTAHRLSDIVHMLAAAVWIGGIAAFAWLLFRPLAALRPGHLPVVHGALDRFSKVGTLAVGAIIATGIVNCLAVVGFPHFTRLPMSDYGKLLIVKLLLFATMLGLAGLNRWRLTPAFGAAIRKNDVAGTIAALRRSLLAEGGAALAILALVAWLGTLEPLSGAI